MTRSFSEWSDKPSQIKHLECGATWDLYCSDWPPKIVICPNCGTAMKLVKHSDTDRLSYRRIKP